MRNGKIDRLSDFDQHGLNELWLWLQAMLPKTAAFKKGGGGGGGGTSVRKIIVNWGGSIPSTTGNGLVWRVPFDNDGSSFSFDLAYAFARIESTYGADISFRVETAPGGEVSFSPTTVTTLTIPSGEYEDENTGLSATVVSGDLLRIVFLTIAGGRTYEVQLIGSE